MSVKRKKNANKFGIAPSVIFINLTIVLAVCILCFLTYNVINGDSDTSSAEPPFTAVTSATETTAADETSSVASDAPAPESTASSDTGESSDVSSESSDSSSENSDTEAPSAMYDAEFFDDALFIGDSITTGLSLYGFLDSDKVFAEQGLAPSTAINAEIDGKTIESTIAKNKPAHIFIMLGTNSVGYADSEYLVSSMKELIDSISALTTAKIYVLSIPPVTQAAELDDDNYLTISAIKEYNTLLSKTVKTTNATFIDFYSVLVDSNGYFNENYAEMDGIHFMGDTYKVMLSLLQSKAS